MNNHDDELAVRRRFMYPVTALLVLSPLAIIFDISCIIVEWGPASLGMMPFLLIHVLTLIGAINMARFRSYRNARAVAIAACFPLCSPLCWLGAPFGIWALLLLLDLHIKLAFGETSEELRGTISQAEAVVTVLSSPADSTGVVIHSGRRCRIKCNDFEDTVAINLIGTSQLLEGETASVGLCFENYNAWIGRLQPNSQIELLANEVPLASGTITKLLDVESQGGR